MKNVCNNIFTVIFKMRYITVFLKMCQLPLLIKLMALIPQKKKLFGCIRLKHKHFADLTLKMVFKIVRQCLFKRAFFLS